MSQNLSRGSDTLDYYVHQTDRWLIFPHELEGLTRDEMLDNKSGLRELFEELEVEPQVT
ncbi:MAG: hypothetical protein AB2814_01720 [Candidatus Sedimenticola endophacoides]